MAHSYHQVYLQAVFAVKYRNAVILNSWKPTLLSVIGNLINDCGCKTIIVNGVEDHIHCFLGLRPAIAISELMKSIKAKSSKFINDNKLTLERFEWQTGYGVFSYHQSMVNTIFHYVKNQEEHHRRQTFKDEYLGLLKEFGVSYEVPYILSDPV